MVRSHQFRIVVFSRVSVVVPTYNHSRFVGRAVESVLRQTAVPREVIVVDDGSTDDTPEVLEQFSTRICKISQKNRGVAAARNAGAAVATGKLLAFLDADDMWLPTKLEQQVACFNGDPAVGLVHCGMRLIDEQDRVVGQQVGGMEGWVSREMLLLRHAVIHGAGSTAVIPRDIFVEVGGFDENLSTSADWDLCYRIACQYRIAFVRESLVAYRLHSGSMHTNIRVMATDMLRAYEKAFCDKASDIQALRRNAYGNLHAVLAGSFLEAGGYGLGARHALKSLMLTPRQALRFATYPVRKLQRRRAGQ